uniref:Ribosomal protein L14 n=1 Tax=Ophirina amphinema TaxID=2108040 RepID=A0A348AYR4_9EUKA|nr:ribosomal protein L14 [Ophirina amphinema]
MIQVQSYLKVVDNSGAKLSQCIKVLGGSKRRYASVGDTVVVAIKSVVPGRRIKKGEVRLALIVRTRGCSRRVDGFSVKFDENAVILLGDSGMPIGTRIFGPISSLVARKKYPRVYSLSSKVI